MIREMAWVILPIALRRYKNGKYRLEVTVPFVRYEIYRNGK